MKNDVQTEEAESRSTVAVAAGDMERTHTTWWMTRERRAPEAWDLDTRTRLFPQIHDDRLMEGDVPESDVRTVNEAVGVGERQDENRRCGDACDSLSHLDEEAVEDLVHHRLDPDTALTVTAPDSLVADVDADKDLEAASSPEAVRERRIFVFVQAEGIERDRHAEAA